MSKVRRKLQAMSDECQAICEEKRWDASFRLIYSSVGSYEKGNGMVIFGLNPAGTAKDATPDNITRPFDCPGYSAYLDDDWTGRGQGESPLQRIVQGIAMAVSGAKSAEIMSAIQKENITPEERIGSEATTILRNTPSGNIIPFRGSKPKEIELKFGDSCPTFGWQLLTLMRPKPRIIITLANGKSAPIWKTILENSKQPLKSDYEKWINKGWNRKYREVHIVNKPLKGALVIGLPGVVHDKIREDTTKPMFKVLARRLRYHGLLYR